MSPAEHCLLSSVSV